MFITFEGIEGCGKSTQCARLKTLLERDRPEAVLLSREPGGSRLGQHLRTILLDPAQTALSSEAELFLYLADRAQHVSQVIRPALDRGGLVIIDRFSDSTLAYQGYGRGLDLDALKQANTLAVQGLSPDFTVLIDCPPEIGLARARTRNEEQLLSEREGRFEAETLDFHHRVRQGFLTLAAHEPERFLILDGEEDPERVFGELCRKLGSVLPGFRCGAEQAPSPPL